ALQLAQQVIAEICRAIDELAAKAGKPAMPWTPPAKDKDLVALVQGYASQLDAVIFTPGKHQRAEALDKLRDECVARAVAGITDDKQKAARTKAAKAEWSELVYQREREMILSGKRLDGRALDQIR